MKINLLYTVMIATTFSSLHIYAMDHGISLSILQQQLVQQPTNKQQQDNKDIPLQEFTHTNKTNSIKQNNNKDITPKKEEYVVIPLNDNIRTPNQNANQETPLKTAIIQTNNTSHNNQSTSEPHGGKLLFAAGGCAASIAMIIYLAVIVSGPH